MSPQRLPHLRRIRRAARERGGERVGVGQSMPAHVLPASSGQIVIAIAEAESCYKRLVKPIVVAPSILAADLATKLFCDLTKRIASAKWAANLAC